MVGAQSDTSVVRRGVPAHGTWEEKRAGEEKGEQGVGDGAVLSQRSGPTFCGMHDHWYPWLRILPGTFPPR